MYLKASLLFSSIAIGTMMTHQFIHELQQKRIANITIKSIYAFKEHKGYYPSTIDSINLDKEIFEQFKKSQIYFIDSSKNSFSIRILFNKNGHDYMFDYDPKDKKGEGFKLKQ